MDTSLIAPCGINCALCSGYQRKRTVAPAAGMLSPERICQLKQLDKRYRTKYNSNLLENLSCIRDKGMEIFLSQQAKQWTCPDCGDLICGRCFKCEPKASV